MTYLKCFLFYFFVFPNQGLGLPVIDNTRQKPLLIANGPDTMLLLGFDPIVNFVRLVKFGGQNFLRYRGCNSSNPDLNPSSH